MPVKEDLGRAAVERITRAAVKDQERAGMPLPEPELAAAFAREVTDRQVKIHEEREGSFSVCPVAPSPSKSVLDRGDVPDDATVIQQGLDDPDIITGPFADHMGLAPARSHDDECLIQRLRFLCSVRADGTPWFPEWAGRIEAAMREGECAAMRSGSDLDRHDAWRRHVFMARAVFAVVEMSITVFGDWRVTNVPETKLVSVGNVAIECRKEVPDAGE